MAVGKDYNKKQYNKKMDIIRKATNNGECWWLYQMLIARLAERPSG